MQNLLLSPEKLRTPKRIFFNNSFFMFCDTIGQINEYGVTAVSQTEKFLNWSAFCIIDYWCFGTTICIFVLFRARVKGPVTETLYGLHVFWKTCYSTGCWIITVDPLGMTACTAAGRGIKSPGRPPGTRFAPSLT